MKLFKISMAIGLCVGCFAAAYGQDTVEYQVTASEYEDLKNSPDKLAEIQSKGYQLVVKDDVIVESPSNRQIESITPHQMSAYQQTPAKLAEFENSTNGNYVVKPTPILNTDRPTQPLSDQDLMKLRLENQIKNDQVQDVNRTKHADGAYGSKRQAGAVPARGVMKDVESADGQKPELRSDRPVGSLKNQSKGVAADGQ